MSQSKKIIYGILVVAIIISAVIYYFAFLRTPVIEAPTPTLGAALPKIDTSVFASPLFKELKIFQALPLAPGTLGNFMPFQKIDFYGAPATSTPLL
jgi:hypothetical protein